MRSDENESQSGVEEKNLWLPLIVLGSHFNANDRVKLKRTSGTSSAVFITFIYLKSLLNVQVKIHTYIYMFDIIYLVKK